MPDGKHKIIIVAGEASGDAHAAALVRRLREISSATEFEFFGATGSKMRAEGVETIIKSDEFAIVGLPEIAKALPMFWRAFQTLKKTAADRKPVAAILVDFPEFNLKLAKSLKKQGIKVVYYISPQLWAWRKYRIETVRKYVDLMLTILPFEKNWYAERGVFHVEYVGNPLAKEVFPKIGKEEFCAKHHLNPNLPIIALLGGSRHKEVTKILPTMFAAAAKMLQKTSEIQFVNALAPTRNFREVEEAFAAAKKIFPVEPKITTVFDETREALNAADAAAVTSGTATLETGIIGTPLVVVYKGSSLNYKILRPLIDVPHFGLVNLIAEKRLAKELIQNDLTPENLAEELFRLLLPEVNKKMREELREVTEKLGQGGASTRAAEKILEKILNQG